MRLTEKTPLKDFPKMWETDSPATQRIVNKHVYLALHEYLEDAHVWLEFQGEEPEIRVVLSGNDHTDELTRTDGLEFLIVDFLEEIGVPYHTNPKHTAEECRSNSDRLQHLARLFRRLADQARAQAKTWNDYTPPPPDAPS